MLCQYPFLQQRIPDIERERRERYGRGNREREMPDSRRGVRQVEVRGDRIDVFVRDTRDRMDAEPRRGREGSDRSRDVREHEMGPRRDRDKRADDRDRQVKIKINQIYRSSRPPMYQQSYPSLGDSYLSLQVAMQSLTMQLYVPPAWLLWKELKL